jgi:hypothetical protein
MNYALKRNISRHNKIARKATTTTASTVEQIFSTSATLERCGRNPQGQTKIRAAGNAADSFLKTTFLPKLKETKTVEACSKIKKTQQDFYQSLSQLAAHYNIEIMQTQQYDYPYNIALALWDADKKLKEKTKHYDTIRIMQDENKTFLVAKERYNTGNSLYYIPLIPLYKMLNNHKRKRAAALLLSVFSYLYRKAGIPCYRDEGSFLYWQYEMMKECLLIDDSEEDISAYLDEFSQSEKIGDSMKKELVNENNLALFQKRLKSFKAKDEWENECFRISEQIFMLYRDYSNESLFRSAEKYGEEDYHYDDEIIGMEKYISFYADDRGLLYDFLFNNISEEFNQYCRMEEPTIHKCFDGKNRITDSLEFEERLFNLIDDLCYLLHNYKKIKS